MSEDITLVCPCCSSTLTIDDCGDAVLVKEADLPEGTFRNGSGTLRVADADGGYWRKHNYLANQQGERSSTALKPPTSFTSHVDTIDSESTFEPIDPELLKASEQDLKDKGVL